MIRLAIKARILKSGSRLSGSKRKVSLLLTGPVYATWCAHIRRADVLGNPFGTFSSFGIIEVKLYRVQEQGPMFLNGITCELDQPSEIGDVSLEKP